MVPDFNFLWFFHNTMIGKIFVTLVDKSGFDSCRFVDILAKVHPELK